MALNVVYTNITSGSVVTNTANGGLYIAPGGTLTLSALNPALDYSVGQGILTRTINGVSDNVTTDDAGAYISGGSVVTSNVNAIGATELKSGGVIVQTSYAVDPSSSTSIPQQIQNIHDAMSNQGGHIVIPPIQGGIVWNQTVTLTKPVRIYSQNHVGGSHSNSGAIPSASTILVGSGITAFYCGQASPALFCGVELSNLAFKSVDGTGTAVYVNNMSHYKFNSLSITGFSNGTGIEFVGNAGQYSRIINCFIHGTKTGIKGTDYNGVQIVGGYIDPANNNATPMASSVGILITNSNADSWDINGTQIQGADTLIDTYGQYTKIRGLRGEIFNTGVILRGQGQSIGTDCSFNNFIYNSGGTCVSIAATAGSTMIHNFGYGAVGAEPVKDLGTNTIRKDCVFFSEKLGTLSATTDSYVFRVAEGAAVNGLLRKPKIFVGTTAMPVDGANYWTVQFRLGSGTGFGLGTTLSSAGGWAANSSQSISMASNDNTIGNDVIRVIITKVGAPADLTNVIVSGLIVPY